MSTQSHEENRDLDSAPGIDENQPKKNPTLKEINETLSFDYMYEHEPFEKLPPQYYPQKRYKHRPPIFDWGITLTTDELEKFGRKNGLITPKPNVSLSSSDCHALLG
ncbi:hypothetical protein L218DRAFT_676920 [Marasmius fiardii PR-910]|nr:hypothetical protein L218DRAFT_676920 [Marasmius fiardii PR-910]